MGGWNSPDIFQEHIHEVFEGFLYFMCVYIQHNIYNQRHILDHALETILQKLVESGLKLNVDR